MDQKVFVNRILNMKKMKLVGFDMDHTLIRYNTKNFETLVYSIVIDKLIHTKKYPAGIKTFTFNFEDAIRGLIIDSRNGNILKLSRYGAIRQSYHGTKPISFPEQKKIYRSIYVDLKDPNYMAIDTSFSIAFCVLYGQLIDYKDAHPNELPSYHDIALDVLTCVDKSHADGSIKGVISQNLDNYIHKDEAVVEGLKRLKRHGKKLFILTNSEYQYTKLLVEYAIQPYLEADENWKDLFDYIITLAGKPRFFYDNPRFLRIDPLTGSMTNVYDPITPGIYQGGCARKFTEDLQVKGDEVLYIGDHIYGDILRLKKDCNWRTALVVEELTEEIASQKRALPVERQISESMDIKKQLEEKYVELYSKNIDENTDKYQNELHALQHQILEIDAVIMQLLKEQQRFYNPRWGRIFRTGAEESNFAYQVDRFACIYMERLSDLLAHSPLTYFRANQRKLAHDLE